MYLEDSTLTGVVEDLSFDSTDMIVSGAPGLGDIVSDAGEQAASQGVDTGEFFNGLWEWVKTTFPWVAEWDWTNILGAMMLLGITIAVIGMPLGRKGRD